MAYDSDATIQNVPPRDSTAELEPEELFLQSGFPERYEFKELLGEGGMGSVFSAFDHVLGRDVAVKLLVFEGAKNSDVQARFLREAKTLASLNHINIVTIMSSGVTESGQLYHVMELLDGNSLSARLGSGPLAPALFHRIIGQLTTGLSHAHSHNIVHRDLKPSNIMLCDRESAEPLVKIVDFGIARFENCIEPNGDTAGVTQTGCILGSPMYMSPEQCRAGNTNYLTDVYSLGCVMFECLTGKPPFCGDSAFQTMLMHMKVPPPSLKQMALTKDERRLGALVDRCLEKESSLRPQSIEQIHGEIESIFLEQVDEIGIYGRTKEPSNQWLRVVPFIGVLILACTMLLVWRVSHRREADMQQSHMTGHQSDEQKVRAAMDEVNGRLELNRAVEARLATEKQPEIRVVLVKGLVERLIEVAPFLIKQGKFDDAHKTFDKAEAYCDLAEGDEIEFHRQWLKVARADCYQTEGDFVRARAELDAARGVTKIHQASEWNRVRSAINLDLLEKNWVCLNRDVKRLPSCWAQTTNGVKLFTTFVQGSPFSLSDELDVVCTKIRRTEPTSARDIVLKQHVLNDIARQYIQLKEARRALKCLKSSTELLSRVPPSDRDKEYDVLSAESNDLALRAQSLPLRQSSDGSLKTGP